MNKHGYIREHLQINIGNLVSDVNIGMFRFRSLLHVTQEFPFESLGIRIKSEVNHITQIGTSNDGQNISTRSGILLHSGLYRSFLFSLRSCSRVLGENTEKRLSTAVNRLLRCDLSPFQHIQDCIKL